MLALLAALGLWVLSRVPLHSLPLTLHGWRYATAPWAVPLLLLFALLWTLAPGVLLLRSEVRAALPPPPPRPRLPRPPVTPPVRVPRQPPPTPPN